MRTGLAAQVSCAIVALMISTLVPASANAGDAAGSGLDIALRALADKRALDANAAFVKAAEDGNAALQGALGVMYYDGIGVPIDYSKALYWLTKADAQGRPEASYRLALLYGNADPEAGAPGFDPQTSDDYLIKTQRELDPLLERRDPMAEATAARFMIPDYDSIVDHLGLPKQVNTAEALLKDAVSQGDIDAMEMLATLYDLDIERGKAQGSTDGLVFHGMQETALDLHERAGLLGHSRAMERVGTYFASAGKQKKAIAWLTAAAKLGDRYASSGLSRRYGISVGKPLADTLSESTDDAAAAASADFDPVLASMAIVGLAMAVASHNPGSDAQSTDTELYSERLRDEQAYWQMRQSQDDFACSIGGGTPNWGGGCD